MSLKSFLSNVFGTPDEASYKIRNAGPGAPIATKITVYDGPPRDMPIDQLVARRKRLAEVLEQYRVKPAYLVRKHRGRMAEALSGNHGTQARDAAEWFVADVQKRAEEHVVQLEQRLAIFDARIKAAVADAGVSQ